MPRRPIFNTFHKPKTDEKPKRKWRILPIIWVAFKRMCMVLGAFVFISTLISVYTLAHFAGGQKITLPDEMVLKLEFENGFDEVPPTASFANPLGDDRPLLREMVAAIDAAAEDNRVKGIYAHMRGGQFELAHSDELRRALRRFKAGGKFTKIYASSYGTGGTGLGRYYLASAFDEIWMQPLGVVSIAGINLEMPFARGLLDRLGVTPQFFQRKDYKTAYESLTSDEMSPENREMMTRLVDNFSDQLVREIAASRGMEESTLRNLVSAGLYTSDEAFAMRLIDHKDYDDAALKSIRQIVTGDPENEDLSFIKVGTYNFARNAERAEKQLMARARSGDASKSTVALVYVNGAIMEDAGPGGEGSANSAEIVPAINQATEDKNIKAIVVRVNSPGGSPVASEDILYALKRAQDKGKKVIVSMGSVAASGGYWVSASADKIFVSPYTITGSIGVVGGKFVLGDLWDKASVNWDSVSWGENADIWSMNTPFSETAAPRINAMLDHVYENFISRVADGRGLERDQVERIAGGRVWSGFAALNNGLADRQGGLKEALNYAAQMLLDDEDATANDLNIILMPKPKTPLEQLVALLGGQVMLGQRIQSLLYRFDMMSGAQILTYEPMQIR